MRRDWQVTGLTTDEKTSSAESCHPFGIMRSARFTGYNHSIPSGLVVQMILVFSTQIKHTQIHFITFIRG